MIETSPETDSERYCGQPGCRGLLVFSKRWIKCVLCNHKMPNVRKTKNA